MVTGCSHGPRFNNSNIDSAEETLRGMTIAPGQTPVNFSSQSLEHVEARKEEEEIVSPNQPEAVVDKISEKNKKTTTDESKHSAHKTASVSDKLLASLEEASSNVARVQRSGEVIEKIYDDEITGTGFYLPISLK